MIVKSCCFSVIVFVCFPFLGFDAVKLSIAYVFVCVWLTFLGWSFPSSTFCKAGFVDRYCLIFLWNTLGFSFSINVD